MGSYNGPSVFSKLQATPVTFGIRAVMILVGLWSSNRLNWRSCSRFEPGDDSDVVSDDGSGDASDSSIRSRSTALSWQILSALYVLFKKLSNTVVSFWSINNCLWLACLYRNLHLVVLVCSTCLVQDANLILGHVGELLVEECL